MVKRPPCEPHLVEPDFQGKLIHRKITLNNNWKVGIIFNFLNERWVLKQSLKIAAHTSKILEHSLIMEKTELKHFKNKLISVNRKGSTISFWIISSATFTKTKKINLLFGNRAPSFKKIHLQWTSGSYESLFEKTPHSKMVFTQLNIRRIKKENLCWDNVKKCPKNLHSYPNFTQNLKWNIARQNASVFL